MESGKAPFSIDPNDKDIVEKANDAWQEEQKPKTGDLSANESNITHPDDDEKDKQERLKQLSDALGVSQIREDVDALKLGIQQLSESQQQIIEATNNLIKQRNDVVRGQSTDQPQTSQGNLNMENIQGLASLADTFAEVWKKVKGDQQPQVQPLISQEEINKKMAEAFYDNLETGESITRFIKDSLKKSATRKIVNQSMKEIGVPHEPE